MTPFRAAAAWTALRFLGSREDEHPVFRAGRPNAPAAPYRITIFVPTEDGTLIVPALRTLYGGTPKSPHSDPYFAKGEPFVGSAWSRPGELIIRPVPCLAEFNGDEDAWREAWIALGVWRRTAARMGKKSEYLRHVRSLAFYAIDLPRDSQFVIVIESIRKDGFDDQWISRKAIVNTRTRLGAVLSRLHFVVSALDESMALAFDMPVGTRSYIPARSSKSEASDDVHPPHSHKGPPSDQPGSQPAPRSSDMRLTAPKVPAGFTNGSPSPASIFVSHASEDVPIVERLVHCLQACLELEDGAIRCTSLPGHGLEMGEDFRHALRADLLECKVVIGLLTNAGLKTDWVSHELAVALGAKKPLCCILGADIESSRVPSPLASLQMKRLGEHDCMLSLLDAIEKNTGCASRNPHLREKALVKFAAFYGVDRPANDPRKRKKRSARST